MNTRLRQLALATLTVSLAASLLTVGSSANDKAPVPGTNTLNNIYFDESHCLTVADMRGDKDKSISCFCRDAIVDARYLYFTYGKDPNLTGAFLELVNRIQQQCGYASNIALDVARRKNWKWNGPEVVRTYPPDDIIKRIEPKDGVRSVPFTIQLIYRDDKGQITHTENYSSYYPDLRFK